MREKVKFVLFLLIVAVAWPLATVHAETPNAPSSNTANAVFKACKAEIEGSWKTGRDNGGTLNNSNHPVTQGSDTLSQGCSVRTTPRDPSGRDASVAGRRSCHRCLQSLRRHSVLHRSNCVSG